MPNILFPAAKHLQIWSTIILGRPLSPFDDQSITLFPLWDLGTYIKHLKDMGLSYTTPGQANSIIVNFSGSEQSTFLKLILAHPKNGNLRREVVNNIYFEYYGEPAPESLQKEWETKFTNKVGQGTALTLQAQLIKVFNVTPAERVKSINNAYQFGMGRNATEEEKAYWLPKKLTYKVVAAAQAPWLYSPAGSKELSDTVDRAFLKETGKKPSATDKAKFMDHIKQFQPAYQEMFLYLHFFLHPI